MTFSGVFGLVRPEKTYADNLTVEKINSDTTTSDKSDTDVTAADKPEKSDEVNNGIYV